jgi:predicted nucleotidyltransferase
MVNMSNIEEAAKRIGSQINAKAVILFGSYAKGSANESSDVDFLVIAESNLPRFKRSRELYKLFKPYPFGMDILVYTPAEIEKGRKVSQSFVSTVLREGKTVYARRPN